MLVIVTTRTIPNCSTRPVYIGGQYVPSDLCVGFLGILQVISMLPWAILLEGFCLLMAGRQGEETVGHNFAWFLSCHRICFQIGCDLFVQGEI